MLASWPHTRMRISIISLTTTFTNHGTTGQKNSSERTRIWLCLVIKVLRLMCTDII